MMTQNEKGKCQPFRTTAVVRCAALCYGNEDQVIADWLNSSRTINSIIGGHRGYCWIPIFTSIGIDRGGNFWTFAAFPSSTAFASRSFSNQPEDGYGGGVRRDWG